MAEEMILRLVIISILLYQAAAQDQVEEICYGTESVVVAVIVTLIVTLGLLGAAVFLYRNYWKPREGKHLMLVTDTENPNDQYAFDNPCFREATPIKHNIHDEKQTSRLENNKWLAWSPLNPFGKDQKSEKVTSLDDSYMNDSRLKVATLKSHDFTGLGFNICGNMRDGIFIKDVLHRGPAFESGCINAGDRIDSVCINFRNMVFEDALAILSYASPYDIQVRVENDSYSRPSTLIRSKRESNAISSTEKILHPKYSRSQSSTHLNEIKKSSNKRKPHQIEYMLEKNRMNHTLNKTHENFNDYPTIKLTTSGIEPKKESQQLEKHATMDQKKVLRKESNGRDSPNKHQKFGIKVLPMNVSPNSGDMRDTITSKVQQKPSLAFENETNVKRERLESLLSGGSLKNRHDDVDEVDGSKENMKAMLTKGFQNLKEKINQNTLGKKKSKDLSEGDLTGKESEAKTLNEAISGNHSLKKDSAKQKSQENDISGMDHPIPKSRSSINGRSVRNDEPNKVNVMAVPEEVSRAGDVAQNNRKSLQDFKSSRKSLTTSSPEIDDEKVLNNLKPARRNENISDSENSTDGDLSKVSDEAKKPKRSKGKAPAPPGTETPKDGRTSASTKQTIAVTSSGLNEIRQDSEAPATTKAANEDKTNFDELDARSVNHTGENIEEMNNDSNAVGYDSDSDAETNSPAKSKVKPNNTKIELTSIQVTVHQSSSGDGNDDEIEPNRKAASMGDLSKLDSEHPLSIVLERAVSLDLADGGSQSGKKRKAPLPPSEEFSAVFDDLNYRKEPRLEQLGLGLNTFQRRLKKSSDFGTLEDALNEDPKSLEIEINKTVSPIDLTKTHNSNIQEFSTWLAECRKPKSNLSETSKVSSTSLVNINSSGDMEKESGDYKYEVSNVSFSVNGKNFPEVQTLACGEPNVSSSGSTSKTVVVISQPNSLEPVVVEAVPINIISEEEPSNRLPSQSDDTDKETAFPIVNEEQESKTLESCVSATKSRLENFKETGVHEDDPPPKLPNSPIPISTASDILSPLTSSLTYITEIKVSTAQQKDTETTKPTKESSTSVLILNSNGLKPSTPKPETATSISQRIQQFDAKSNSVKPLISPIKSKSNFIITEYKNNNPTKRKNHTFYEPSKIPIKTMKSETGQKVLATIQSLTPKEVVPTKIPEVEYAKRVASLFAGNSLERGKRWGNQPTDQSAVSELYIKGTEEVPKPSKQLVSSRKIPPVVPPRKLETSLSTKSFVTVESSGIGREPTGTNVSRNSLPSPNDKTTSKENSESNLVTFSSFAPRTKLQFNYY